MLNQGLIEELILKKIKDDSFYHGIDCGLNPETDSSMYASEIACSVSENYDNVLLQSVTEEDLVDIFAINNTCEKVSDFIDFLNNDEVLHLLESKEITLKYLIKLFIKYKGITIGQLRKYI